MRLTFLKTPRTCFCNCDNSSRTLSIHFFPFFTFVLSKQLYTPINRNFVIIFHHSRLIPEHFYFFGWLLFSTTHHHPLHCIFFQARSHLYYLCLTFFCIARFHALCPQNIYLSLLFLLQNCTFLQLIIDCISFHIEIWTETEKNVFCNS